PDRDLPEVGRVVGVHRQRPGVEAHLTSQMTAQVALQPLGVDLVDVAQVRAGHQSLLPGSFSLIDSVNSCIFCFTPLVMTPISSGSPLSIEMAAFLPSSHLMCGGIGGISGSVTTSSTHGRSAASASSHASPSCLGSSTLMPLRPSSLANSA